jgi:hypothetical protein
MLLNSNIVLQFVYGLSGLDIPTKIKWVKLFSFTHFILKNTPALFLNTQKVFLRDSIFYNVYNIISCSKMVGFESGTL